MKSNELKKTFKKEIESKKTLKRCANAYRALVE